MKFAWMISSTHCTIASPRELTARTALLFTDPRAAFEMKMG